MVLPNLGLGNSVHCFIPEKFLPTFDSGLPQHMCWLSGLMSTAVLTSTSFCPCPGGHCVSTCVWPPGEDEAGMTPEEEDNQMQTTWSQLSRDDAVMGHQGCREHLAFLKWGRYTWEPAELQVPPGPSSCQWSTVEWNQRRLLFLQVQRETWGPLLLGLEASKRLPSALPAAGSGQEGIPPP